MRERFSIYRGRRLCAAVLWFWPDDAVGQRDGAGSSAVARATLVLFFKIVAVEEGEGEVRLVHGCTAARVAAAEAGGGLVRVMRRRRELHENRAGE